MNLVKKYLVKRYIDVLANSQILIFCELSSFTSGVDYLFKKKLKKNGFLFLNPKSKLFKSQVKGLGLASFIEGPIFIIYKPSINFNEDLKFLFDLLRLKMVLGVFCNKKIYNLSFLKWFKGGVKSLEDLYIKQFKSINFLLSLYLNKNIKHLNF